MSNDLNQTHVLVNSNLGSILLLEFNKKYKMAVNSQQNPYHFSSNGFGVFCIRFTNTGKRHSQTMRSRYTDTAFDLISRSSGSILIR